MGAANRNYNDQTEWTYVASLGQVRCHGSSLLWGIE